MKAKCHSKRKTNHARVSPPENPPVPSTLDPADPIEAELQAPIIPEHLQEFTPKVRLFIMHYAALWNGTRAIMLAGFTDNQSSASSYSTYLLRNPKIREAIDKELAIRMQGIGLSVEKIIQELSYQATIDMAQYIDTYSGNYVTFKDPTKLPPEVWKCIKSIKHTRNGIAFELYDRQNAAKLLGDYFGMWKQKIVSENQDGEQQSIGLDNDTIKTILSAIAGANKANTDV